MKIKILGVENAHRKQLENKVKTVLSKLSLPADIQIISLLDDILKYDVAGIPALVVDEQIVCAKNIPGEEKILKKIMKIIKMSKDNTDLVTL